MIKDLEKTTKFESDVLETPVILMPKIYQT